MSLLVLVLLLLPFLLLLPVPILAPPLSPPPPYALGEHVSGQHSRARGGKNAGRAWPQHLRCEHTAGAVYCPRSTHRRRPSNEGLRSCLAVRDTCSKR